jgi:hypothetical protein
MHSVPPPVFYFSVYIRYFQFSGGLLVKLI